MASKKQKTDRALNQMRKAFDAMQSAFWSMDDMENYDMSKQQAARWNSLIEDMAQFVDEDLRGLAI